MTRVIAANTVAESDRLSHKYGIKGLPGLFLLGSVKFPASFPFDFMHLIFKNLVPNLIWHYMGDFKGLDTGTESYELPKSVWDTIGDTAAQSGDTIPSDFGAQMPNIYMEQSGMTATGGKGSFTQWVHAEYMEGSEIIRPTFTQWVRGGYFSKVPTKVPTG